MSITTSSILLGAAAAEGAGQAIGHIAGPRDEYRESDITDIIPGKHGYELARDLETDMDVLGGGRLKASSETFGPGLSTMLLAAAAAGAGALYAKHTGKDILTTAAKAGGYGLVGGAAAGLGGFLAGLSQSDKATAKDMVDYAKSDAATAANFIVPGAALYNAGKYNRYIPLFI